MSKLDSTPLVGNPALFGHNAAKQISLARWIIATGFASWLLVLLVILS